ncbi:hypothetical protein BJF77_11065 [Kocuria sp. CNJ-770]|nr:hypothetical protein BJF77_11065 [Kocuria sp. CNJ-770]
MTPDEALAKARERLQEATTAHHQAREESDKVRAALVELEAAADRGEDVDADEYGRVKSTLGIRSRRTAALAGRAAEADRAVSEAQQAVDAANIRTLAAAVPSAEKARQKAIKAAQDYATALKAEAEAVAAVHKAAKDLPLVDHTDPQGTGWATTAGTNLHGVITLNKFNKLGWLIVEGKRVAAPVVGTHLGSLSDEIGKLGQSHGYRGRPRY